MTLQFVFFTHNRNITESLDGGNVVIDDIETMLANLSNQLDAMLEQEITPSSSLDQRYQHHNHVRDHL
jgi:hypothetical protein